MSVQRWTSQPLAVPRDPEAPWQAADVEFEDLAHDGSSFAVLLYLDNPGVPEDAGEDGPGFAGRFTVFAHGRCWGDVGHCDVPAPLDGFDRSPVHPLTPINVSVNVTDALQETSGDEVTVTALAFGADDGDEEPLRFARLSLITYD